MKITLISPYKIIRAIGIRSLSACLKKEGHDVKVIFLRRDFKDRYKERTLDEVVEISRGSDLIGVSLMTNYFDNAIQITQKLKKSLNIPVLWGGIHPTIRPEECLNHADIVCLGEGEEAFLELLNKIRDGQNYYSVRNMWFKNKGEIVKNGLRPLIQDLNTLPFPDYDSTNHYILNNERIYAMDEELLGTYMRGIYPIMATRGCPFGCTYCCNNTFNTMYNNQKPIRKRNTDNIMRELIEAKNRLSFVDRIYVEDDCFFINKEEEIKEFSARYKKDVSLPLCIWGAFPSTVTREKLSLLTDAGLILIKMGIQSGSERTKKMYKRNFSSQQIEKVTKLVNEFKDKIKYIKYDIILDNPWETDEDLVETLMLLSEFPPPFHLSIFSLTFYPGTELYEMAKRDCIIKNELEDVYRKYYHGCKNTYMNKLFYLLGEYVDRGDRLSPKTVALLTNRALRQLKMGWILYALFKSWSKIKRIKIFLLKKIKDRGKIEIGGRIKRKKKNSV